MGPKTPMPYHFEKECMAAIPIQTTPLGRFAPTDPIRLKRQAKSNKHERILGQRLWKSNKLGRPSHSAFFQTFLPTRAGTGHTDTF